MRGETVLLTPHAAQKTTTTDCLTVKVMIAPLPPGIIRRKYMGYMAKSLAQHEHLSNVSFIITCANLCITATICHQFMPKDPSLPISQIPVSQWWDKL